VQICAAVYTVCVINRQVVHCIRTPSHSCGVSLAIWDHTVLPSTQHKRITLNPNQSGWYSIYLPRRDGRFS